MHFSSLVAVATSLVLVSAQTYVPPPYNTSTIVCSESACDSSACYDKAIAALDFILYPYMKGPYDELDFSDIAPGKNATADHCKVQFVPNPNSEYQFTTLGMVLDGYVK